MEKGISAVEGAAKDRDPERSLLHELVAHLRHHLTPLREEWTRRITEAQLLRVMTADEIFSEVTAVYDNYVDDLETGSSEPSRQTPRTSRSDHSAWRRNLRSAWRGPAAAGRIGTITLREVPAGLEPPQPGAGRL